MEDSPLTLAKSVVRALERPRCEKCAALLEETQEPGEGARSRPELSPEAGGFHIIRFPEVRARTGLSRSTLWRLERAGQFPRRRQLSPRCVGWILEEVEAWIGEREACGADAEEELTCVQQKAGRSR